MVTLFLLLQIAMETLFLSQINMVTLFLLLQIAMETLFLSEIKMVTLFLSQIKLVTFLWSMNTIFFHGDTFLDGKFGAFLVKIPIGDGFLVSFIYFVIRWLRFSGDTKMKNSSVFFMKKKWRRFSEIWRRFCQILRFYVGPLRVCSCYFR